MTSRYWSSLHRRLQRYERSTACRRSALSTDDRTHEQSTPRMIRSYDVEYTRSRPISEVKLRSARPVLGTEMAWEALVTNLLPVFCLLFPSSALCFCSPTRSRRRTHSSARKASVVWPETSENDVARPAATLSSATPRPSFRRWDASGVRSPFGPRFCAVRGDGPFWTLVIFFSPGRGRRRRRSRRRIHVKEVCFRASLASVTGLGDDWFRGSAIPATLDPRAVLGRSRAPTVLLFLVVLA